MSFYFNIQSSGEISYSDLIEDLKNSQVKFHWQPENSSEPIKGTKIFIPGKSTRGITISKEDNSYSVGINVIASEEDFNLAVETTRAIAKLTNGAITPEDSEGNISIEELKGKYNQDWIDTMKTLGTNLFLERIGKDGHLLSIGCCYMKYTIGPNIHKGLDDSSELNYYNSLVKHIQGTQFFNIAKYQIPQVLVSTNKDGSNRKTYVVFYPHGSQFLSHADYVVFPVNNGKYEIPYDQIHLIADSKFNKIDETQYTIDSLTANEYQELTKRIESELGKIDEETIKSKYQEFSKDELDDEFNRLASIPDARVKIFVLQRMSNLISEYEKRNIPMPNSQPKIETKNKQESIEHKSSKETTIKKSSIKPKKPWWKIW